jgi:hypothetical protein
VEIQDGTIRNPAILSFQHRAPEYPTSAAEGPAGRPVRALHGSTDNTVKVSLESRQGKTTAPAQVR